MRIRTHLRRIRVAQHMSIRDVCARTGLALGEISMFERGHSIPRDDQAELLTRVYGDPSGWYPATVRHALAEDAADCQGCGDELEPDSSRRRRYHDEACRAEAAARRRRTDPT